jgi:hypothetical protein
VSNLHVILIIIFRTYLYFDLIGNSIDLVFNKSPSSCNSNIIFPPPS